MCIFFLVCYEANDNFQYIIRFRKKKPYQTKPKKLHVSIKKKKKIDYR
jgi:hypothetical protein